MKTVLITGASGGIGRALVQKFLDEDYFIVGTFLKDEVNIKHEKLVNFRLDVTSVESIKDCIKKISNLKKSIDILINNAGVVFVEEDGVVNIDFLRKTLEVNLIGLINFTNYLTPMINKGGHVVNISSRQGSMNYISRERNPSYNISKAALNMFTRTLSMQLRNIAIVSSVHPGAVKTKMAAADANMEPEESAQYIYDLAI